MSGSLDLTVALLFRAFAATLADLPHEVRAELDPDKKRKNPKARKRALKKRAQEALGLVANTPPSHGGPHRAEDSAVVHKRKKKRF